MVDGTLAQRKDLRWRWSRAWGVHIILGAAAVPKKEKKKMLNSSHGNPKDWKLHDDSKGWGCLFSVVSASSSVSASSCQWHVNIKQLSKVSKVSRPNWPNPPGCADAFTFCASSKHFWSRRFTWEGPNPRGRWGVFPNWREPRGEKPVTVGRWTTRWVQLRSAQHKWMIWWSDNVLSGND